MTQEEAIKILRGVHDKALFSVRNALETLIPELRESEDERIRKWLVDYFTEIGENWIHREFTCKQIVAYLEKQKEQPKEELVYRLNGFMQEYIKEGKDAAEKEHRFKCYQLFWDALEDENFFEQKKQKPVEGLEEAAKKYKSQWDTEHPHSPDIDFIAGEEWMKCKVLKLIESRISEIIGDAQPNPILRLELQGIIDKIK